MPKFRKKPLVVEAMQFTNENKARVFNWVRCNCAPDWVDGKPALLIDTLEGTMRVSIGDWIIRGVQGEYYPCKPHIFEATYEPIEGGTDAEA